jgi:hypothetical protein
MENNNNKLQTPDGREMTPELFRESSKTWYLYAHYDARRSDDIALVKALYEQRIKELEWRIATLEEEAAANA